MKILVTGVNGYIGSMISQHCLELGNQVLGIDLCSSTIEGMKNHPKFQFKKADIKDLDAYAVEQRDIEVLIHCAALVHKKLGNLSKENYYEVNTSGTAKVLSSVERKSLKQVIFLSTVSVYGDSARDNPPNEKTDTAPDDFYGESKLAAEQVVREYSETNRIPHTIFRLVPVYGKSFLLNINKRIYLPTKCAFYRIGSGNQKLSLISINNVVNVIGACIGNPTYYNETFIAKDDGNYSVNEIISTVKEVYLSHDRPVFPIPACFPRAILKLVRLISTKKAKLYEYRLNKIADNTVYSGSKLRSTGVALNWNLRNTLKQS